jgi:hypothetical protein
VTETLSQLGPAIEDGAVVIVQDTRLRIRHLPIEQK